MGDGISISLFCRGAVSAPILLGRETLPLPSKQLPAAFCSHGAISFPNIKKIQNEGVLKGNVS